MPTPPPTVGPSMQPIPIPTINSPGPFPPFLPLPAITINLSGLSSNPIVPVTSSYSLPLLPVLISQPTTNTALPVSVTHQSAIASASADEPERQNSGRPSQINLMKLGCGNMTCPTTQTTCSSTAFCRSLKFATSGLNGPLG